MISRTDKAFTALGSLRSGVFYMKNCKIALLTVLSIWLGSVSWADSEPDLPSYITASERGQFYFKMVPDPSYDREKGAGICFEVIAGETDKILWKTAGWYSLQVYLSEDGEYLARMGHWPRGQDVSPEDLAVAFYKKGELLKSYSTMDLIKDSSSVERTLSHYSWIKGEPVYKSSENQLIIVTTENIEYTFDMTSGEILNQRKL